MASKKCNICGNPSGIYPLCKECFIERDNGNIEKCDECGTWHRIIDKCKCEPKPCMVCKKTQNKTICNDCNKSIYAQEKLIKNNFSKDELDEIYYTTKYVAQNLETEESFLNSIYKLIAVANVSVQEYFNYNLKNKIESDIEWLCNKREENKNKEQENNNEENSKLDAFEKDYRKTYPTIYRCNDGHYVRSKSEREIDNFLYEQKIWHEYEKEEYDPSRKETYYIDFFLPEHDIYIEHFGLDTPEYNKKSEKKLEYFKRNSCIYITTTEKDANTLNDILKRRIKDIEHQTNIKILNKK